MTNATKYLTLLQVHPKRLGPKRATKIRRFFGLSKEDDVSAPLSEALLLFASQQKPMWLLVESEYHVTC